MLIETDQWTICDDFRLICTISRACFMYTCLCGKLAIFIKVCNSMRKKLHKKVKLQTVMTCPSCGSKEEVMMTVGNLDDTYTCKNCHSVHHTKSGKCCVYCSYGTRDCPAIQDIYYKLRATHEA